MFKSNVTMFHTLIILKIWNLTSNLKFDQSEQWLVFNIFLVFDLSVFNFSFVMVPCVCTYIYTYRYMAP